VSVEVHGFADKMNTDAENVVTNSVADLGGSAPVEIRFKAVANDPVAALYVWKIYKKEVSSQTLVVRFPGEELVFTFDKFGDYVAELEVTDRSGKCSDNSYSREIKIVESSLEIPNAFSPGTSPGINDEFRVAYKSLVKFNGTIFNRWGVEMFHWTNPAEGWDGKKGGKFVTPGVYFYIIEAEGAEGKKYNRKGDINILRSKNVENE
jgi:gliding motility-associated-like protein